MCLGRKREREPQRRIELLFEFFKISAVEKSDFFLTKRELDATKNLVKKVTDVSFQKS